MPTEQEYGQLLLDLATNKSDMQGHIQFLHDTVVRRSAQIVLELGTNTGKSTLAFLLGLQKTNGILYSCDIAPCQQAIKNINKWELSKHWQFTQMDDRNFVKTWTTPIDILLIDTDHTMEHTLQELKLFAPHVKSDGIILIHDMACIQFGPNELTALCKFLAGEPQGKWFFSMHTHCYGMGMLERTKA